VPLTGVPIWTDQEIDLYHGTLDAHVGSVLQGVDLNRCGFLRDFGRGFYTTTNRLQAERWARGLSARNRGATPAVIRFSVQRNDLAVLETLVFVRGTAATVDFWSFVQFCRTSAADHGRAYTLWYDLVAGPVMGSLRKQTVVPDGDQLSFHSPRAVAVLDNSNKVRIL
jgi:hypothetical protein